MMNAIDKAEGDHIIIKDSSSSASSEFQETEYESDIPVETIEDRPQQSAVSIIRNVFMAGFLAAAPAFITDIEITRNDYTLEENILDSDKYAGIDLLGLQQEIGQEDYRNFLAFVGDTEAYPDFDISDMYYPEQ